MATFFITGGCGFIGQWLTKRLIEEDHEVTIYDIKADQSIMGASPRVKIIKGRTDDAESLTRALKSAKPETLVHLAALLSATAEGNPQDAYSVNIASAWPLWSAARSADVKSILFASTAAVYGPGSEKAREDRYHIPSTIYGISKIYGEMVGTWFSRTYGIDFAAFRYASVIGPGRGEGGASAYTSLIVQKAAEGEPYTVQVPARAQMPIVYVKDAVDATLFVHRNIRSLDNEEMIFNVPGISPGPTAGQLARIVKRKIPKARIDFKPDEKIARIVDSWARDLDSERIARAGWKPVYSKLDVLVDDFVREVTSMGKDRRA
ncbi:MAG: NAD-dependent epimerase/dehydratase family protein [Thaumarchaeota archaeon]|nr:NAD-dependent epimerase/dehydratase family protein [Nitrososphaerota archaeon]